MTTIAIRTPRAAARAAREPTFSRERLCDAIERLIALLDALDGDPDLEPSLGSLENHPEPYFSAFDLDCHLHDWAGGASDDREHDAGDEPEEPGAQPVLGWAEPDVRRMRRARLNAGGACVAA